MAESGGEEMDIQSLSRKSMTSAQRSERLKLRQEYRELINEVQKNKEELAKPGNYELLQKVNKANTLFQRVETPREGALDSRFMALSVSIAGQKTNQLQTDLMAFYPEEFVEKLLTKVDGRIIADNDGSRISSEFWPSLGKHVMKYFNSITPALSVISGTLDFVPAKSRNVPPPREDTEVNRRTQPQHLTQFQGDRKEATPEEIERVLSVIRHLYERDPIPIDYFELIVNPNSFGHTVENMFHLAFLVKDGWVRIFLNENKIPVVEPVKERENDASQNKESCNQVMVSLSMEEWRGIIDAYQLSEHEPYIKPLVANSAQEGSPMSSKRAKI